MDMMSSIAGMAMGMQAAQLQQNVSLSGTKKSMDSVELAAQELLKMLPSEPGLGGQIDTYA